MQPGSCSVLAWKKSHCWYCVWLQVCALCLCIKSQPCMCLQVCLRFSVESKWWKAFSQQSFRIIFLGMGHIFCFESYCTINIKLTWIWNIVWVHRVGLMFMVNEAAPSCLSACHHRLESQLLGFLACGNLPVTTYSTGTFFKVKS